VQHCGLIEMLPGGLQARAFSVRPLRAGEQESVVWTAYDAGDGIDYGWAPYTRRPGGQPVFDEPVTFDLPRHGNGEDARRPAAPPAHGRRRMSPFCPPGDGTVRRVRLSPEGRHRWTTGEHRTPAARRFATSAAAVTKQSDANTPASDR
jgi:hypothetical protein